MVTVSLEEDSDFSLCDLTGRDTAHQIEESIRLSEGAYRTATRRGGLLERIGQLQRKIEIIAQNRRMQSDVISEPVIYFAGHPFAAGVAEGLEHFGLI